MKTKQIEKSICLFLSVFIIGGFVLSSHEINNQSKVITDINDTIIVSPWGMNAHLTFDSSFPYAKELCASMHNAGVGIMRLDVYWWYNNMFMQLDKCDEVLYWADYYGIDVLLNFPQMPNRTDGLFLRQYVDMLTTYAERYNGNTEISVGSGRIARKPTVKYIEVLNEIGLNYKRQGLSVSDVFTLLKTSSIALKNSRNDSLCLIFPDISPWAPFMDDLLSYQDEDKRNIASYYDAFNYHVYTTKTTDFCYMLSGWKKQMRKYGFEDKDLWITECGMSLWEISKKEQALTLEKQYMIALSEGVSRIFYYQFHGFGGNYFDDRNQKEDYFGIIGNSLSNSYASFLVDTGTKMLPLSDGDALEKLVISSKHPNSLKIRSLTKGMIDRLTSFDLLIGGSGYDLDAIKIKKKDGSIRKIWEAPIPIPIEGQGYRISKGIFNSIDVEDEIWVIISGVKDISNNWVRTEDFPAYKSFRHLSHILNAQCTRPIIESNGASTIAKWFNKKENKYYYAIWNEQDVVSQYRVIGKDIHTKNVEDIREKRCDKITVARTPVYISSTELITIKRLK